jgi:transposase
MPIMTKKRNRHSAEFKARVALEAVKGLKTSSELSQEYQVQVPLRNKIV